VTYKALHLLIDHYYKTIDEHRNLDGIKGAIALFRTFMDFCENNFLYSEALLDYFALVRATSSGTDESKLTEAVKESMYYNKLQDIQNLPFKLTVKEIERGKRDGSILESIDPMFFTIHGWTTVVGYVKVISATGKSTSPLFNVSLRDLKAYNLKLAETLLSNHSMVEEIMENIDLEKSL
jgi:hypothetical protein